MITDSTKELNDKLFNETYSSLFLSSNDKIDTLWQDYGKTSFYELINDPKKDDNVRFLAAEILFHKTESFPKEMYDTLGNIYAHALKLTGLSNKKYLLSANGWGFLYNTNNIGSLGERFILIGQPAGKYLVALLENKDMVLYEGSQEATLGNSYHYRIKDIAAFYIAKIRNIPIQFHQNTEDRDKEIEHLKKLIGEN